MKLVQTCTSILDQLADLIHEISDQDYSKPSVALSKSTIGQHLRHTLEFFICFEQGSQSGTINYDKRKHDKAIETDRAIALQTIMRIKSFISTLDLDKKLELEVNYHVEADDTQILETTTKRELVYNIEHAVHHMAIMKIGIREIAPYVRLNKDFGVAASTVRYQGSHAVTG